MSRKNILYAYATNEMDLQSQKKQLIQFAELNNLHNYEIYEDLFIPDKPDKRLGYLRLYLELQTSKIENIYVTDLSVLSTDASTLYFIFACLEANNSELILINSHMSSNTAIKISHKDYPSPKEVFKFFNFHNNYDNNNENFDNDLFDEDEEKLLWEVIPKNYSIKTTSKLVVFSDPIRVNTCSPSQRRH